VKTKKATKPKPEPKYCDWCGCEIKGKIYRSGANKSVYSPGSDQMGGR